MAVPTAPSPPPNCRGNCFSGVVWRGDLGLRFDPDSGRERRSTSGSALAERFWVHFRVYLTDDGRSGNQSFLLNFANEKKMPLDQSESFKVCAILGVRRNKEEAKSQHRATFEGG